MRSDKEQFEKITGDYEAHKGKVRARRKMWTIIVSAALVTALLVSSVIVLPGLFKDEGVSAPIGGAGNNANAGETTALPFETPAGTSTGKTEPTTGEPTETPAGTPTPKDPTPTPGEKEKEKEYYITDGGKTTELSSSDVTTGWSDKGYVISDHGMEYSGSGYPADYPDVIEEPVPVAPGEGEYTPAPLDPGDPGEYVPGIGDYQAGQLTGAEIVDRAFFGSFVNDMAKIRAKQSYLCALIASKRVKVTVKNGDTPLSRVKVQLCADQMTGALYTAVTDVKGEAFLFYNLTEKSNDHPTHIIVTSGENVKTIPIVSDGEVQTEVTVDIEGANGAKKLDLMFMIDTTGSMGDELEYLKVEISDIIARIYNNGEFPVRTSVNFYRDKGDQYIVHATPFTTDVNEVLGYISGERAWGGGDYPEAVHTALKNAVIDHEWDEGAEKLLFVVLDAPPHDEKEVADSLYETILEAAAKGIRVIPIVSSGSDDLVEYLMRTYAVLTGGTYTFLTDHSGYGGHHADPNTEYQFNIEMLNAMIVRIANEYLGKIIDPVVVDFPTPTVTPEPTVIIETPVYTTEIPFPTPIEDPTPEPGSYYEITVNDPDGFIISCPKGAKPGTEVEIRTCVVFDAYLVLTYVDYNTGEEKQLTQSYYDSDYWAFVFTMPGHPANIEVHVYDGFLD